MVTSRPDAALIHRPHAPAAGLRTDELIRVGGLRQRRHERRLAGGQIARFAGVEEGVLDRVGLRPLNGVPHEGRLTRHVIEFRVVGR